MVTPLSQELAGSRGDGTRRVGVKELIDSLGMYVPRASVVGPSVEGSRLQGRAGGVSEKRY